MPHPRPARNPTDAIHAVSRLLDAALDASGPAALHGIVVREARQLLGADAVALLALEPRERLARPVAGDPDAPPASARLEVDASAPLRSVVDRRAGHAEAIGLDAIALAGVLGWRPAPARIVLLPLRSRQAVGHVLAWSAPELAATSPERMELATAFASAAAAALAQLRLAEEQAARGAEQAALARAARTLNERGLDLPGVLHTICREARAILDGDHAVVYRGDAIRGLRIEACVGLDPQAVGDTVEPGQGLSGRVVQAERALLTNDYRRVVDPDPASPFAHVSSCLAVPMHWDGALRGVLSVGYTRERFVGARDLALLEAFAQIAAAACRNASTAASLALAARTDGLTGCLNRAALQESLDREVERAERGGRPLSLVLVDLDEFKQVNERAGHLVGDEVLRRVGHALRVATRPYDVVARYGGDEFAIVAVDSTEASAAEVAARAIDRIHEALHDLGDVVGTVATAGVAEREPGATCDDLIAAADRALLFGKQHEGRGTAVAASSVPPDAGPAPAPPARPPVLAAAGAEPAGGLAAGPWDAPPPGARPPVEHLHRRTRQLSVANALGARLVGMTTPQQIVDAVCDELHRGFGYFLCAAIQLREDDYVEIFGMRGAAFERLKETSWSQPRDAGIIGRALRGRQVVLVEDVRAEPEYVCAPQLADVRSELVAPIWAGDQLWGVLDVEELEPGALDEADAQLLETVADMTGAALRGALLYERLERAYLGTAEALAAALEAKDSYTASHAQSIVAWAEAVGRRLGLDAAALRALRYGAVFHDIGKIAVPEEILNKQGPLSAEERLLVERHTVVGEQILAPVEFLRDVLPIVRHEHERWDGGGYPDGLSGHAVPLGARIVFVCDAYHAMTSDRPYRSALDPQAARAELRGGAGTQFDPRVVDAFLEVLDDAEE